MIQHRQEPTKTRACRLRCGGGNPPLPSLSLTNHLKTSLNAPRHRSGCRLRRSKPNVCSYLLCYMRSF